MKKLLLLFALISAFNNLCGQFLYPLADSSSVVPKRAVRGNVYDMAIFNDEIICVGNIPISGTTISCGKIEDNVFVSTNFPMISGSINQQYKIFKIVSTSPYLVVSGQLATYHGVSRLSNGNWIDFGIEGATTINLIVQNNNSYIAVYNNQMYSRTPASDWTAYQSPEGAIINDLEVFNGTIFCIVDNQLYRRENNEWIILSEVGIVYEMSVVNNRLLISTAGSSADHYDYLEYNEQNLTFTNSEFMDISTNGEIFYLGSKYVSSSFYSRNNKSSYTGACRILDPHETNFTIQCPFAHLVTENIEYACVARFQDYGCVYQVSPMSSTLYLENDMINNLPGGLASITTNIIGWETNVNLKLQNGYISMAKNITPFYYGINETDTLVNPIHTLYTGLYTLPGPVANNFNSDYIRKYGRSFVVSQSEIEYHILHFNEPNYIMPIAIRDWPAHGDVSNGESYLLAPFIDANNNFLYDPQNGDFPQIKGSMASYTILNDNDRFKFFGPIQTADTGYTGVEKHILTYLYDTGDEAIDRTLFFDVRMVNRSGTNFSEFKTSVFGENGTGLASPRFLLTDTINQCAAIHQVFSENSTFENLSGNPSPGAISAFFLTQEMTGSLTTSTSLSSPYGSPEFKQDYYLMQNNRWKNGEHLVVGIGGNSQNQFPPFEEADFIYPNNIWDATTSEWCDTGGGERIFFINGETVALENEEEMCFSFAVSIGRDENANTPAKAALFNVLSHTVPVRNFYNQNPNACPQIIASIDEKQSSLVSVHIFPNPGNANLTVEGLNPQESTRLEIYDLTGRLVALHTFQNEATQTTISTNALANGTYILKIVNGTEVSRLTWIKRE